MGGIPGPNLGQLYGYVFHPTASGEQVPHPLSPAPAAMDPQPPLLREDRANRNEEPLLRNTPSAHCRRDILREMQKLDLNSSPSAFTLEQIIYSLAT
ncbi:hypothetical protein FRX31_012354 [Thalictrum thalictroides]|uniref:Uncharacterized protein n=1 Tax=Thalictrum thalictroides TaxID=46969 RepID=A0A7J6WN81_THATH|nr:hypothetical protein FRX31_012354 [Thalictrum thalictroides]